MAADVLADMRANPRNIRFADALEVAEAFFGPARRSGSHHVFRMPWPGDPRVNLQEAKDGKAKPYQVRRLLAAIDRVELTHADQQEAAVRRSTQDRTKRHARRRH
jgi:hypothetical protein